MNKTKLGLPENLEGAIAYLFAPITSIILLILDSENKFVKFHSFQSMFLSIILGAFNLLLSIIFGIIFTVMPFLFFVGTIVKIIVAIITLIIYIVLIITALRGRMLVVPFIGDIAWNLANN